MTTYNKSEAIALLREKSVKKSTSVEGRCYAAVLRAVADRIAASSIGERFEVETPTYSKEIEHVLMADGPNHFYGFDTFTQYYGEAGAKAYFMNGLLNAFMRIEQLEKEQC
jgi:hypothetical protein